MNSTIIDCLDKLIKASHKARFLDFTGVSFINL